MRNQTTLDINPRIWLLAGFGLAVILAIVTLAHGHGGKHAEAFTNLEALQQGTALYDKLLEKGKLDESWEAGLASVTISTRQGAGGEERVVAFKRENGEPSTVYIFFKADGTYAGSNFTGE